jgi:hypothetical protein
MKAFLHNMNLKEENRSTQVDRYIHLLTTDRLQHKLAEEYREGDQLRMFNRQNLTHTILTFQVLLVSAAYFVLQGNKIAFSYHMLDDQMFDRCIGEEYSSQEQPASKEYAPEFDIYSALHTIS